MARHFLGLYLLIVITLVAVSWGQDRLLQVYDSRDISDDRAQAVALSAVTNQLQLSPVSQWKHLVEDISARTGGRFELFARTDIAGRQTLDQLQSGRVAYMEGADGESWAMSRLNKDFVLALRTQAPESDKRGPLEWAITLLFYAVMAFVIMIWLWPLTRDLRALEKAVTHFGNKNWVFDARIGSRSQVFSLAQTFRKMAARIDGLIASHRDMSNAVSHEIKTPLSRMQFEIELAQQAKSATDINASLLNIKADIAAINDLVSATMSYAILERASLSLNIGVHDFSVLLPAMADFVRRDARPDIEISAATSGDAGKVFCDLHLMEAVVKNLLYNAARYARREVRMVFSVGDGVNQLLVDDDGPGIPPADRLRVFGSFVQLDSAGLGKKGFGLGLAIVKRAVEWHNGQVFVEDSVLGGARFCVTWPVRMVSGDPENFTAM